MAKIRDMSKKQFAEALARHGMTYQGFMGYVDLGIEGHRVSASHLNAGSNRRAKLAYLLERRDYFQKQIDKEEKSTCAKLNAPV